MNLFYFFPFFSLSFLVAIQIPLSISPKKPIFSYPTLYYSTKWALLDEKAQKVLELTLQNDFQSSFLNASFQKKFFQNTKASGLFCSFSLLQQIKSFFSSRFLMVEHGRRILLKYFTLTEKKFCRYLRNLRCCGESRHNLT